MEFKILPALYRLEANVLMGRMLNNPELGQKAIKHFKKRIEHKIRDEVVENERQQIVDKVREEIAEEMAQNPDETIRNRACEIAAETNQDVARLAAKEVLNNPTAHPNMYNRAVLFVADEQQAAEKRQKENEAAQIKKAKENAVLLNSPAFKSLLALIESACEIDPQDYNHVCLTVIAWGEPKRIEIYIGESDVSIDTTGGRSINYDSIPGMNDYGVRIIKSEIHKKRQELIAQKIRLKSEQIAQKMSPLGQQATK